MNGKPQWTEDITAKRLVELIRVILKESYSIEMTRRARSELRKALETEIFREDHEAYETGTASPQETAERIVELAAGELQLKFADEVTPSPKSNSLEGYTRFGVEATKNTITKAKAYQNRTRVCPVWPF